MKNENSSIEIEVANYMSLFNKRHIGRGPRDVTIKIVDDTLIYFIKGLLTQMEKKILQATEGKRVVLEARKLFVENTREERIEAFERIVGSKVVEHYTSWEMDSDSAVGVVVFENKIR